MRIYLDANVLFSAAKSAGAVRFLLERLAADGHTLVADGFVIAEARRNLEAKGGSAVEALDSLLAAVEVSPMQSAALPRDLAALLPEKDQPVLAAAISLNCRILVTGDRTHFGPLFGKTLGGVAVRSPRSLADELLV